VEVVVVQLDLVGVLVVAVEVAIVQAHLCQYYLVKHIRLP
jgi:hypothetical protein